MRQRQGNNSYTPFATNAEVIDSLVEIMLLIAIEYGTYARTLSDESFDLENYKSEIKSHILEMKLIFENRYELGKVLHKDLHMLQVFECFDMSAYEQFLLAFMIAYEMSAKLQEGIGSIFRNTKMPTREIVMHLYEFIEGDAVEDVGKMLLTSRELELCFIQSNEETSILKKGLRLEKNFVHYLLGATTFEALEVFQYHQPISNVLIYDELLEQAIEISAGKPLIYLYGQKSSGKKHFAKNLGKKIKKDVILLSWDNIKIRSKEEQENLVKQVQLYLYLQKGVVCMENASEENDSRFVEVMHQMHRYGACTIVTGIERHNPLYDAITPFVAIHLYKMSASEKIEVWEKYREEYDAQINSVLCGNKYVLNIGGIHKTFQTAQLLGRGKITTADIENAIKMLEQGLSHATLIRSSFQLDDLVVEQNIKRQLEHIIHQLQYKNKVYDEWGFGNKTTYGRGISAMFYGPPGTGKTMAASVIANALSLDLYRVDISKMVSKYIGETEKNISQLFDEAKDMNILLFFDEADALFAKRMEVKDSNDRNSNAETAHLLQKLEEYEGVAILATNLADQIDEAFSRRIKFMIKFTFPDVATRKMLWSNLIPKEAEVEDDLYIDFFAERFELSGSQIKEIIINAAYISAAEGTKLSNEALKEALILNYQKYDKILGKDDFMYF